MSPRPNQKFEVGVFCGSYVTPVDEGYFDHLDNLRGSKKKDAELDNARKAIVAGMADGSSVKAVMESAAASQLHDKAAGEVAVLTALVNGTTINAKTTNDSSSHEAVQTPRRSQDISLHNFNDHEDS